MAFFDREENPATDIKTLVELARRKKLLVARGKKREADADEEGVDQQSGCGPKVVQRYGDEACPHTSPRHISNAALDAAHMICHCSIHLEEHRVDLHDGEAFNRGTTKVWDWVHMDLIRPFYLLFLNNSKNLKT